MQNDNLLRLSIVDFLQNQSVSNYLVLKITVNVRYSARFRQAQPT